MKLKEKKRTSNHNRRQTKVNIGSFLNHESSETNMILIGCSPNDYPIALVSTTLICFVCACFSFPWVCNYF
uniref:Uncharacterized protein n=1 Tax=Iconisemion striatum TaxID=60296 RepID=A0A1A7Z5R5_9TELE